jgi:hypothetical protein
MKPTVSYRLDVPTIRPAKPQLPSKPRSLPHGAGFVLALPLALCFWAGLLVWWLT